MGNDNRSTFLKFLPVSIFGAVMGLSGLSFAWRLANHLWHFNFIISEIIAVIAILLFIVLFIFFAVKFQKDPAQVKKEINHPVTVSLYGTIIISLLLIPGLLLPFFPGLAIAIWIFGAVSMLLFAWFVLRMWLDHQQLPESAMPVWVIPIVGTLDVPIVGSHLPIAGVHEICMMFFGIGVVFTFILLTMIISRLMFQAQLPAAVQPTLLVLTSPLALAFTGYTSLTGGQDTFSTAIFYFNIFLFALIASKIILLPKTCPFSVSWWSVSFPMAAVTISALHYAEGHPGIFQLILAGVLLLITSFVIIYLIAQSLYRIFAGTFSPPAQLLSFITNYSNNK
jgi:tellurite resistance protein